MKLFKLEPGEIVGVGNNVGFASGWAYHINLDHVSYLTECDREYVGSPLYAVVGETVLHVKKPTFDRLLHAMQEYERQE